MKAAALVTAVASAVFEAGPAPTEAAATTVAIVATAVTGVDLNALFGHFPEQFQVAQVLSIDTEQALQLITIGGTDLLFQPPIFMRLETCLIEREGKRTADYDADKTTINQTFMPL
jgi:hypothetical protein